MKLKNIQEDTRKLITSHLRANKITLNGFCKSANINQPNIYLFMKGKEISSKTLQKIGAYLNK